MNLPHLESEVETLTKLRAQLCQMTMALHRVNELSMNATVGCYNATTTVREIYEVTAKVLKGTQ